jgi:enolase
MLVRAIETAGLTPGEQVGISLDIAASELGHNGQYRLPCDDRTLDSDGMCALVEGWLDRYPIVSVEDPLGEDDPKGLAAFTRAFGERIQIIGDDFLVTNAGQIEKAAKNGACNAVLLKPNQAGTLTETYAALTASRAADWGSIVSARSGESEDVTIVHLAVGWSIPQLKVGALARSERTAKWNEGLRIMQALGQEGGRLPPCHAFPWARAA